MQWKGIQCVLGNLRDEEPIPAHYNLFIILKVNS